MERKRNVLWHGVVAVVLALGAVAAARPLGLVGHWAFDEGQGTTAFDSSGNGLHGTLMGGPTWVPGQLGGALDFNGSTAYVQVPNNPLLARTTEITIAAWTQMRSNASGEMAILSKGSWAVNDLPYELTEQRGGVIFWQFYNEADHDECSPNAPAASEWHHLAATYDGHIFKCYIDGKLGEEWAYAGKMPVNTSPLTIGRRSGGGTFFNGRIDDVQLWSRALSEAEVNGIMAGLVDTSIAQDPSPQDQATDVPRDTALSWTAGEAPATHDVYFGTVFADVDHASRTNPGAVLAGRGQADTTSVPGVLDYGRTYYWRIDEVNKSADGTIFRGDVWSFTVEPYGYPVTPVAATASTFQPGMGPEKTIDGSGLTGDLHGVDSTTMWLSTGVGPNWIRYEFHQVYKLHQLQVWNANQLVESIVGFGARKATIETSMDGAAWTPVADVPEFSRAPGADGYAANTTVQLGGVAAKYVRLTITANWGGMAPSTGLAEVRFFYVPVQARAPEPANAATGVDLAATLDWRPGREATSHQLYFGTEPNAVAQGTMAAQTLADHGYVPDSLHYGTTYCWKVDEVGPAGTYPGDVWRFSTREYALLDDFESYTDEQGHAIFETWPDGIENPANGGSQVGNDPPPYAEGTIVHTGKQSMPLFYNNTSATYSETTRTFATPQDWTVHGADTLSLWFRGRPAPFLEAANGDITLSAMGADIYNQTDEFRFAYQMLNGDGSITVRVDRVDNITTWTKAGLMIRESPAARVKAVHLIVTPSGRAEFQYRPALGGNTTDFSLAAGSIKLPYWLRLTRSGYTFIGEHSADGKTWQRLTLGTDTASTTLTLGATACVGIVVCSQSTGVTAVAQFSNIQTTGNVTGPWQVADVGVNHGGNSPADLYAAVQDSGGKSATAIYPNGTIVTGWTEWRIPWSDFAAAGVKLTAVKKLTLGVGNSAAPQPGGTGKIYLDDVAFGHPVP